MQTGGLAKERHDDGATPTYQSLPVLGLHGLVDLAHLDGGGRQSRRIQGFPSTT